MAWKTARHLVENWSSVTRRKRFPGLSLGIQVLGSHPNGRVNVFGFAEFDCGSDPNALTHGLGQRERLAEDLPNPGPVIAAAAIMEQKQQAILWPGLLGAMPPVKVDQELLGSRIQ
jgi:hypothetical protein